MPFTRLVFSSTLMTLSLQTPNKQGCNLFFPLTFSLKKEKKIMLWMYANFAILESNKLLIRAHRLRKNPVNTRRCFDVDSTLFERYRRQMDVKTTLCAYWESTIVPGLDSCGSREAQTLWSLSIKIN